MASIVTKQRLSIQIHHRAKYNESQNFAARLNS